MSPEEESSNISAPSVYQSPVAVYVAACCSVLQYCNTYLPRRSHPVCCSVLQCVAVCCSVLQCAAVCCSVLQCVAGFCSVLQCFAVMDFSTPLKSAVLSVCAFQWHRKDSYCVWLVCVLQCVAVCCSVLQCVCFSMASKRLLLRVGLVRERAGERHSRTAR